MKVILIGSSNTVFTYSYESFLRDNGLDVKVLNVNPNVISDSHVNFKNPTSNNQSYFKLSIKKIVKALKIDSLRSFVNLIEKKEIDSELSVCEYEALLYEITEYKPDLVIFFWGTTLRKESKALSSLDVKKMLIVNSYPVRTMFSTFDKNPFILEDKNYFSSFDYLVLPSEQMEELFEKSGFLMNKHKVIPDFLYNKSNKINKNKSVEINVNKIIFLGNTDFNLRKIDDISKELIELADSGFEIYIQPGDNYLKHPNIHFFTPLNFEKILKGDLHDVLRQYDAVLFSYNDPNHFRYNCSITTRFALCEGSGVPLIIKGAVPKSLLNEHLDIDIINYSKPGDLKNITPSMFVSKNNGSGLRARQKEFLNFVRSVQ